MLHPASWHTDDYHSNEGCSVVMISLMSSILVYPQCPLHNTSCHKGTCAVPAAGGACLCWRPGLQRPSQEVLLRPHLQEHQLCGLRGLLDRVSNAVAQEFQHEPQFSMVDLRLRLNMMPCNKH